MTARAYLVGLWFCVLAAPAAGQSGDDLVRSAIRSYNDLELDVAAGLLRRALAPEFQPAPSADLRSEALAYLGATEVIRGNRDSARAAFRRLVRLDPRHRLDPLVFPPEVSDVFESVRLTTKVALVVVGDESDFRPGERGFRPWLVVSSFQRIEAAVLEPDGSVVRTVYAGPVSDSLQIEWDARRADGTLVRGGRYLFSVSTEDAAGTVTRIVRVPLDIAVAPADTNPLPQPLDAASLLPERLGARPGVESLAGGVLIGAAVIALSTGLANGTDLSSARFGIGGAVTLAGVVGFLRQRPGKVVPENVESNRAAREAWRERRDQVARDNERIRRNARVTILTGLPQVIEQER